MNIKILSLGWGNIQKLRVFFANFGNVAVVNELELDPKEILVLPGVGNFSYLSFILSQKDIKEKLAKHYEDGGKLIGICSGFQILFQASDESSQKGLGYLNGKVTKLKKLNLGWNITTDKIGNVYFMNRFGMMESLLPDNESFEFYFSTALSGEKIVSHCVSKKILGLQFHPEVSRRSAYQIIEKFLQCE